MFEIVVCSILPKVLQAASSTWEKFVITHIKLVVIINIIDFIIGKMFYPI